MTKAEFISKIPLSINHPSWGYGDLEIIVDNKETKGACYRHESKLSSYGTYGESWVEVFEKLSKILADKD
jgi:hypothetical protein